MIWIAALVLFFASCNQTPSPSPTPLQGYSLEVRGGTTNLDNSFLYPSAYSVTEQDIRSKAIAKVLMQQFGIQIDTQATAAVGANLYISVLKDGIAPTSITTINVAGYQGTTQLDAGQAWDVLFPLVPLSSGNYAVTAKVSGITLNKAVDINTKTPSNLLPIPQNLQVYATPKLILGFWDAVTDAKSYIALLYDKQQKETLWAGATTSTSFQTDQLKLEEFASNRYELTVFALSWDIAQSVKSPYPKPVPTTFDASAASRVVYPNQPTLGAIEPKSLIMKGKPGQTISGSITLNTGPGGPLTYGVALPNGSIFQITSPTSGLILPMSQISIAVQATCPNQEDDILVPLSLSTTDPRKHTQTIPLVLECAYPIKAERIFSRIEPTSIYTLKLSPDAKKIATAAAEPIWKTRISDTTTSEPIIDIPSLGHLAWGSAGQKIAIASSTSAGIWDVTTGKEDKRLIEHNTQDFYTDIDWNPLTNKIAIRTITKVYVFDGSTGQKLLEFDHPHGDPWMTAIKLAWSPDGSMLAVSAQTGVFIYSSTGTKIKELTSMPNGYFAWKPDGSQLATYTDETGLRYITLWDTTTWGKTTSLPIYQTVNGGILLKWSPDGNKIANEYAIWRASDGTLERDMPYASFPILDWKGSLIALSDSSTWVRLLDGATGNLVQLLGQSVRILDFAKDQPLLVGAGYSGLMSYLSIYNYSSGSVKRILLNDIAPISVRWIEGTTKIAGIVNKNGEYSYFFKVWDSASRQEQLSFSIAYPNALWSPDGKKVAIPKPPYWYFMLSETGSGLSQLNSKNVPYPIWSPDSNELAIPNEDKTFDIYTVSTGEKNRTLNIISADYYPSTCYNYDQLSHHWLPNRFLCLESTMAVADLQTGIHYLAKNINKYSLVNPGQAIKYALSPNGKWIAIVNTDSVDILSITTGEQILRIQPSVFSKAVSLSWSKDSTHLAIGSGPYGTALEVYRISPAP